MISFTDAELSRLLAGFMWPFARIAAFIATAPILGNFGIPGRVKLILALGVTIAIMPGTVAPAIDPWSGAGLAVLVQQMLTGAAMALAMRIVFAMVDLAGEMIGMQMGLSFATFFDPQHGAHTPVVAQFLGLLTTLAFLAINGHLMLLGALAESFKLLPLGAGASASATWLTLADWGGKIFSTGLTIALPVIAALLITNIALGILTRAAPQLNLFAVGFPITIMIGWVVLWVLLPTIAPVLMQTYDEGLRMMLGMLPPP